MQTASRLTLQISVLALGIAGALAINPAHASGFQLRENSVKNLGRSNAGSAVAKDDATVVTNNPAAMVNLEKTTVQIDATNINLNATFTGGGKAAAAFGPAAPALTGGNGGDPGRAQVVPAISVVVPFGKWTQDPIRRRLGGPL
jgi:long-chain fatty acid transport protein